MIDNYERFRKAYRTIAFATAFTYFYHENLEKQKLEKEEVLKAEEAKKQEFLDQFKELSETIVNSSETKEKTSKEIKDEQFKRNIEKFRAKYHEDPTPAEYQEIRQKIYGN
jgi:uncharacterized protein YjaZ